MTRRRLSLVVTLLLGSTILFATGCDEWVSKLARQNLGSFVVDIVQTAVNETLDN